MSLWHMQLLWAELGSTSQDDKTAVSMGEGGSGEGQASSALNMMSQWNHLLTGRCDLGQEAMVSG